MKKAYFILFLSLFSLQIIAQTTEREAVSFLDLKYPEVPFIGAESFSVELEAPTLLIAQVDQIIKGLSEDDRAKVLALKELKRYGRYPNIASNYLAVPGLEYAYSDGDITIVFEVGKATLGGTISKEKVKECGTKEAPKQCTSYYYEVVYTSSAKLTVKDKSGTVLYSEVIFNPEEKQKAVFGENSWGEYDSAEALAEAYKNDKSTFEQVVTLSSMWQALIKSATILESKSFYVQQMKDVTLASAKKKFDYSDLDKAMAIAFEGIEAIEGKVPGEATKSKLEEAIAIWSKALEEFDPGAKKVRINDKIAAALYHNIGYAYLELNEIEKAREYAAKAEALGKFSANVKVLQKELEEYAPCYEASSTVDPAIIEKLTLPKDLSVGEGKVDINLIMDIVKPNM